MSGPLGREAHKISTFEGASLARLVRHVCEWSKLNGRDFPWRVPGTTDFERICTEVLLQRTRAETVGAFYNTFFSSYRNWELLSKATEPELQVALRPLGLWQRRAASLSRLASYAAARGGRFPDDAALHQAIPAVGQYVSNAILLFQYHARKPLLDVNMARVIERYVHARRLVDIRYDPWLQAAATRLVSKGDAVQINWAILDFAAKICTARNPSCQKCPVMKTCAFYNNTKTIVPFGKTVSPR